MLLHIVLGQIEGDYITRTRRKMDKLVGCTVRMVQRAPVAPTDDMLLPLAIAIAPEMPPVPADPIYWSKGEMSRK